VRPLERRQALAAAAVVVVLFAGHLIFGANRNDAAIAFSGAYGLLLAGLMLLAPWARQDAARTRGLLVPALLFTAVIAYGLWTLAPAGPGLAHPAWRLAPGAAGAITLDRQATVLALVKLLGLASVFLIGVVMGGASARARIFLILLTYACGAYAAWAFVAFTTDPHHVLGITRPYHEDRLGASFFSANSAGMLFGMGVVLSLGLVADLVRRGVHSALTIAFPAVCLALSGVCLALSASRGAMAATALAGAALAVAYALDPRSGVFVRLRWPLVAGAAVLLALFAWSSQTLVARLMQTTGDLAARREIIGVHWSVFQSRPLLGQGLGAFEAANRLAMTPDNFDRLWSVRAAHNVYLQWLEEAGWPAALAMFLCIAWILGAILAGRGRRPPMVGWVLAVLAASLVPILHGLVDYGLQVPSLAAFWACLLGVGFGLTQRRRGPGRAHHYVAETSPDANGTDGVGAPRAADRSIEDGGAGLAPRFSP
jgi:O-antigen ligase